MSILEKEVWIKIVGRNFRYYEDLGYSIPRVKNKKGMLKLKIGEKILVKVDDLPKSGVRITKICDICGTKVPNQTYQTIAVSREQGDGKDRCRKCGEIFGTNNRKNNVKYENSLEHWAKVNNKEYLLDEFSNKNDRKPSEISYGNNDKLLWNCPKCKNEYDMSPNARRGKGRNCPYCAGRRVNYTNCLCTTRPEVAMLLFNHEDGNKYTSYSSVQVDWKCPDCGEKIKNKRISTITVYGLPLCPSCSDGISYPEKLITNILNQLEIQFEFQKRFKWSNNKIYDFYIPSLNCIIETHGLQHYVQPTGTWGLLSDIQENDINKEKIAKKNKIENYIIIDCRQSEIEYIKNNILESELSNIINLSHIDWSKCNEFARNSLVKVACELWDKYKNSRMIASEMKLGKSAIIRYLKQGAELGWCDYDPEEERVKAVSKNGKDNGVPIVRLSLEYEYIDEFESIEDVKRKLGINNVSAVCRGLRNKAGGYRWMYKKDYNI